MLAAIAGRVAAYVSLTKPRLVLLVLVTVAVGFLLGIRGNLSRNDARVAGRDPGRDGPGGGGAGALNQWLERDRDARMRRTANRALPSGRLAPSEAAVFGGLLVLLGTAVLLLGANLLAAEVARRDVRALCLRLHAAQTVDDAQHGDRGDPRRIASGDRLGGRDRPAGRGSVGLVPDRVPLAVSPLPGDRLDLSRRLPACRVPDADGGRSQRQR